MKKFIVLIGSFLYGMNTLAQQPAIDTAFQTIAEASAKKIATRVNAMQPGLYNGAGFLEQPQTSFAEFPYFLSNDWINGAVDYDGVMYEDVPLMYDIVNDWLITEIPQNGTKIRLVDEKIGSFMVNGLLFVKVDHPDLPDGFLGQLYNGPTKVYIRCEKSKQEKIEYGKLSIEFDKRTRYYLLKNGKYFIIRNKADVLTVLGDRKSELKQFIKKNQILFKRNKEKNLVKLAEFYDNIPH